MNEIKRLNRMTGYYEKKLSTNDSKIRANINFHIEQIEPVIKEAKLILDNTSQEVERWAELMPELYQVDDANTLWQKIELKFLILYSEFKYDRALKYFYDMSSIIQRLEKVLIRLNQIKYLG